LQIHLYEDEGDILVFLTGQEEIEDLEDLLLEKVKLLPKEAKNMLVVPLYAALPSHAQLKAFEKSPEGTRKIILSTNVAETSITIKGIKYVVDTGLVKMKTYSSLTGTDSLKIYPISQNSSVQRAGRAGRESAGKCFRLYTQESCQKLEKNTQPEILRCNLSNIILQLKAIGVKNVSSMDLIEKPKDELFKRGFQELHALGAINTDGSLTDLGKEMSILPTDPIYSKLLLTGISEEFYQFSEKIIIIVSMLSVENIFYQPRNLKDQAEKAKRKFQVHESDHLTLLNIYEAYIENKKKNKNYARENFINEKAIKKAMEVKKQLQDYLKDIYTKRQAKPKTPESEPPVINTIYMPSDERIQILKCLTKGLLLNVVRLESGRVYMTIRGHLECNVHPTSVMAQKSDKHQYLVYNELIVTSKTYMRYVSVVDADWVKDLKFNTK